MECEYLFCHEPATQRVTVPKVRPQAAMCDEHAKELLDGAQRYRAIPGMVQVDSIKD